MCHTPATSMCHSHPGRLLGTPCHTTRHSLRSFSARSPSSPLPGLRSRARDPVSAVVAIGAPGVAPCRHGGSRRGVPGDGGGGCQPETPGTQATWVICKGSIWPCVFWDFCGGIWGSFGESNYLSTRYSWIQRLAFEINQNVFIMVYLELPYLVPKFPTGYTNRSWH